MKALRLKIYQQTACYKKPFAFKVSETYPLPPYSTVKGMVHSILGADSLIPMKISIQGIYDTIVTDYQTHYFFKRDKTEEFALTADGLGISREFNDITTMPIYMHMLYDVNLVLHIQAADEILEQLESAINSRNIHFSLGRWEDLVRVDECEIIHLQDCGEPRPLHHNAFVPIEYLSDVAHFPYKLNWTYEVINNVRVWNKIQVGYVQKGLWIEQHEQLKIDPYGDLVFFHID
ncbi:type I-B CRISPR-associated protein Cas5 [Desulfuribacillus stibiiarsenatis]|uniref:Type I-B CRISPR-associated protein Cas5 n=1 Tax=Desulfuribacillus stibiiarsenatis TaxID=1390249 RepID=A0A1E5L422_9FIRM|nr:type I-B CRISPR-associated protein Cas5b [Desulfuribacillus stibiiarsenatis]OEH84882.1 type I-B CRISPR-associated protein Cas5 [Desulfuribacillus stibiiarsenatis]